MEFKRINNGENVLSQRQYKTGNKRIKLELYRYEPIINKYNNKIYNTNCTSKNNN